MNPKWVYTNYEGDTYLQNFYILTCVWRSCMPIKNLPIMQKELSKRTTNKHKKLDRQEGERGT